MIPPPIPASLPLFVSLCLTMAAADEERPIRCLRAVRHLRQWAGVSRAHDRDLPCGARWCSHLPLSLCALSALCSLFSLSISLNSLSLLDSIEQCCPRPVCSLSVVFSLMIFNTKKRTNSVTAAVTGYNLKTSSKGKYLQLPQNGDQGSHTHKRGREAREGYI